MEKDKRHLPQIKLFKIVGDDLKTVETLVNDYVIEVFSEMGNLPEIKHSGDFISVICERIVETNY